MPPLCMYGPVSSTFRRPGVLKAPCAPAGSAAERGRLSGPIEAPMPRSSLMRRTPVLKNPVSEPPLTRPLACTLEAEAELVSAPAWHLEHCPLPVKMPMPLCSWALRAPWLPSRNWSTRELSETSVASYIWMADRKSTRLNSSHGYISYAVFCLKKKKKKQEEVSMLIRHE